MLTSLSFCRSAAAIAAVAAAVAGACGQILLPPGGTVVPPIASTPGVILYDTTTSFDIFNSAGALLFRGKFQDRVARIGSGSLDFECRIRDVTSGLNGTIARIDRFNFGGYTTRVSYSPTSLGTVIPSQAWRSLAPGSDVQWRYSPGIFSSQESKFASISTNATSFNTTGFTVITLTTGDTAVISNTTQPASGTPRAIITGPAPFSCACSPITITGTADAGSGFTSYTLEYSSAPAGPWTNIVTSVSPVVSGTLATWNTSAIATGEYFVRLRVTNNDGEQQSFTTIMHVDSSAPAIDLRAPVASGLYGGVICFDGTVDDDACFDRYTLSYQKQGFPFVNILTSTTEVINDPLGNWDASGMADGTYTVRLDARDVCGHISSVARRIEIDNTAPVSVITRPENCSHVSGLVAVGGTAFDANISGWELAVTGGPYNSFVTIASGGTNIVNDLIAFRDTTELPACCYTLRLRVTDRATVNCSYSHQTDYYVSVDLAPPSCAADVNQDGGIDGADVDAFFELWEAGGC
ncbi:MAG: hypothetical protein NTV94_01235 [Planctomycetota bacterium]|nr:hypothetical protein [Planctomycetota bacterium]